MDGGSLEQLQKCVAPQYHYITTNILTRLDFRVKEDFRKQGGTIQHEYSLIKGFT